MRTFEQYFFFWFLHFVNCGEPSYVLIEYKDYYLKTMAVVKSRNKPVNENLEEIKRAFKEVS